MRPTLLSQVPADSETLAVSSIYQPNKSNEAEKVFGADDQAHPAVHYLHNSVKDFYVGGAVQAINSPEHYDYVELRCEFARPLNWGLCSLTLLLARRHPPRAPRLL